ncbi:MAG: toprim domain-containing protein, partial [Armatimonadota bacterium]|nr:toprim domain-containing protein [Armatimonadota bacterium]
SNTFRCWVCPNFHGTVIHLVMMARGCTFEEAVQYLAARAGMQVPHRPERRGPPPRRVAPSEAGALADAAPSPPSPGTSHPSLRLLPTPPPEPPPIDDERLHTLFSFFLRWCDRPAPSHYLVRRRGISLETVQRMRIVQVQDPTAIALRLRREFPMEELLASGLFNRRGFVFQFHPVVFPFLRRERVCYLQGRRLDGREPKYLSISRPIPCLYNHDVLDALPPGSGVILSEGVIDTLTWIDWGVPAVGILGIGAFKEEWVDALKPFRVFLCLDADEPGQRVARQLQRRLSAAGVPARLVALPEGIKDVNQLAVERPDLVRGFHRHLSGGG